MEYIIDVVPIRKKINMYEINIIKEKIKNFNTINDMVVKAPAPGFFMTRSEEGKRIAKILIQNGYIMLNEEIAKIYFYYTKTGYIDYSDIPADIYLNMLLKENTKYADSDDTFNEMYKIRI